MEPDIRNNQESSETVPADDSPTGWFNLGYSLATKGQLVEAERALKIAVDSQEEYPIAWAILSAVLLSQGRETDAEKAGKMALSMCDQLKLSWPKLRSIMFAHGILRGKDWRSPRRIRFESSDTTEWGSILKKLSEYTSESLEELEVLEVEADKLEGEDLVEPVEDIETQDDGEPLLKVGEPTDEKSADVWFGSARVHTSAGRYDEAEMAYRRGLAKYPSNGEARLRLGTLLMRRDAFDIAEESLVEAVKYLPDSAEAWLQLGICLQSLEKWDESADALKMASDLDPQNVEIWVKLGEADYYRSLYEEAARSFLRALRREPNNTYALFYLGRCMEYRGNNNHALRVYRKLLNINPVNPEILEELAKSFHRLGSMAEAQRAKSFASHHRRAISKKSS